MSEVYGGHGPLEIPEWLNQNAETDRKPTWWTPARMEIAVIAFVLVFAWLVGYALLANHQYELGKRHGVERATAEVCADLPDSEHYSRRCRP